jgi:hypothetical protein
MKSAVAFPFIDRNLPKPVRVTQKSPSPDAVRKQLSNILQSDGFAHARRMKRFLGFVVEETLAGRARQLCEYSIGMSVFDRDESFEPGLDPIVRNDARRLRQKLLEYYLQCGHDDPVLMEVPKGGYVPVFRCTSRPETANARRQYRLIALLTRADGTEVWTTDQEFQVDENSEELCFALRLEERNQGPPVSMLPISQYSDRVHKWSRSRERAAKVINVPAVKPRHSTWASQGGRPCTASGNSGTKLLNRGSNR